jgi:putative intracellular protease/amidase
MKALIIATNHDKLLSGKPTGAYLSEIAHPWDVFRAAGIEVSLASPCAGKVPLDPFSMTQKDEACERCLSSRFLDGSVALAGLDSWTFPLAFFAGGHGAVWDFPSLGGWVKTFLDSPDRVLGAVCHGVAVCLSGVSPMHTVSCFTDAEEALAETTKEVPFLLETELLKKGFIVRKAKPWAECVSVSGQVVTGQNPASARGVALGMLRLLPSQQGFKPLAFGG